MGASLRDKAARRATEWRTKIQQQFDRGDYRAGIHEAHRWLLGELEKVRKQRPQHAEAIHREVAERIASLAEAIPLYDPTRKG